MLETEAIVEYNDKYIVRSLTRKGWRSLLNEAEISSIRADLYGIFFCINFNAEIQEFCFCLQRLRFREG